MAAKRSDKKLCFNGISAETGDYLLRPMRASELGRLAAGHRLDPLDLGELKARQSRGAHYGPVEGLDPRDLAQTGWGVIFPHARRGSEEGRRQEAIREALKPLLDLRREQAGERVATYFRECVGPDAYRPGESKQQLLARLGVGPGPADPARLPYYLMLVGDPSEIPFRVQSQLDVQYAVGRIHFDQLEDYHTYARSVVTAETGGLRRSRRVALWGVDCPDDPATRLSARHLIAPLETWARADQAPRGWEVSAHLKASATKAQLARLLGGDQTPALLFTASHGMGWRDGHPDQRRHQGALLCQDWPGPRQWGRKPISPDLYFSADDLASQGSLLGLMSFFFACFGGGTPRYDQFAKQEFRERRSLAPSPFVAALPRQMLCHPKGGALAVIGHVDRAWGYSFLWEGTERRNDGDKAQLAVFQSTLKRLMEGHPVGSALEYFNARYAELASDLSTQLELLDYDDPAAADEIEMAALWTASNDARGYAIIGDPAVRLALAEEGGAVNDRETLEIRSSAAEREPVAGSPRPGSGEREPAGAAAAPPAASGRGPGEGAADDGGEETVSYFLGLGRRGAEGGSASPSAAARRLRAYLDQVMGSFGAAVKGAAELEVRTYTSRDVHAAANDARALEEAAQLRAYTCVSLDGDIDACVPVKDGDEVDMELWKIHLALVEQAQANRKQTLSTAMDMVARLMETLKLS